jgi:hypothetical protein
MSKKRALILASGIACTCITAADLKKPYSPWVKQADTIYIYSAQGTPLTEISIRQNPSLATIKEVLRKHGSLCIYPIKKRAWFCWNYLQEEISQGKIKDHMEQYDTDAFWIKGKPRKPHQS